MALSSTLGAIAVALTVRSAIGGGGHSLLETRPVALIVLTAVFFLAELYAILIEFRREAHSLTLAGVPLAIGVILLPTPELVLARVVGSLIAFALQRPSLEKTVYNTAAYAFEAALAGTLVHAFLGADVDLALWSAAVLLGVIVLGDQLMSALVLVVIRLHSDRVSREDIVEVLVLSVLLSAVTGVVGIMAAVLLQAGVFGDVLVAVLVAFAILVYRTYAATTRRHQALEVVHDFVTESVGAESIESLGRLALSRMRGMVRATSAELLLAPFDGAVTGEAVRYARISVDENDVARREWDDGVGGDWVVAKALHHGEATLLPRSTKDPAVRRWLLGRGLSDAIVVPLRVGDELFGAVIVKDRLGESFTFTDDDLTLLQTLAGHLGVSLRSTHVLEKMSYEATHDSLTGLVNRAFLNDRVLDASAAGATDVALLLFDLNKFKEVNDVLGHEMGDQLLVVVAQRLLAALPPGSVIARLGGDEFAVLVHDLGDDPVSRAERLAATAREQLATPVRFGEALLVPESSVGVAVANIVPFANLLRCADTAMYAAKDSDSGVAVYDTEMDRGRAERLALLADLRLALDEQPEQFVVFYQAKFDLLRRTITGAEALVRWHHPERGTITPDHFIPLAETSGLIERLTTHVLTQALHECARWHRSGHDLTVSVNLSPRNVKDSSLPQRVDDLLAQAGVPADRLILEITESSVMEEPERAVPVLHQLADRGIGLSLDDFGTGYSSLSYLQQLPVNELKIDRSFVMRLDRNAGTHAHALVRSITALARNLGLRVVAEGIETEEQLAALIDLGCEIGQGY